MGGTGSAQAPRARDFVCSSLAITCTRKIPGPSVPREGDANLIDECYTSGGLRRRLPGPLHRTRALSGFAAGGRSLGLRGVWRVPVASLLAGALLKKTEERSATPRVASDLFARALARETYSPIKEMAPHVSCVLEMKKGAGFFGGEGDGRGASASSLGGRQRSVSQPAASTILMTNPAETLAA